MLRLSKKLEKSNFRKPNFNVKLFVIGALLCFYSAALCWWRLREVEESSTGPIVEQNSGRNRTSASRVGQTIGDGRNSKENWD